MNPSPPARAVEQTLRLWLGDRVGLGPLGADAEAGTVQVLSFQEHFEHLWGVDGQASPLDATAERTLVLVYDDVSRAENDNLIDVSSYVTAYDWLVYALLEAGGRGEACPPLRVLLLDLMGNRRAATFGEQTVLAFLPLMPWVHVHRLFSLREAQRPFHYAVDIGFPLMLEHVMAGGGATVGEALADREGANRTARVVKELWRSQLLKPGNRHSLSNLVAPLLLEQGFSVLDEGGDEEHGAVASSAPRKALMRLMHALDLVEQPEQSGNESDAPVVRSGYLTPPLRRRLVEDDVFGAFGSLLRVLLLDDDALLGFDTLIRRLFSETSAPRARVQVETSPENIVDALSGALQREPAPIDWRAPRLFELPEGGPDLLLLDLRLFGEREEVLSEEQTVLKRLLGLFDRYFEEERVRDEALLLAVGEARERLARGRSRSLRHLALLPLLLAHFDPSLPVMLFSSTRQRELLDLFRGHPNIITRFGKPAVTGYESGSPKEAAESLCEAIVQALRLHEARTIWRRFQGFEATHEFSGEVGGDAFDAERLDYSPEQLRRSLRDLYVDYVLKGRYFDFVIQPYQLLQNGLVGEWVRTHGHYTPSFRVDDECLWDGLNTLRNRVAHGYASRTPTGDYEEHRRLIALAMFHLFLDLLGDVREDKPLALTNDRALDRYKEFCSELIREGRPLGHVNNIDHLNPLRHFIPIEGLTWIEVFVFSVYFNLFRASESCRFVSVQSAQALDRLLGIARREGADPPPVLVKVEREARAADVLSANLGGPPAGDPSGTPLPYLGTVCQAPEARGGQMTYVRPTDESYELLQQLVKKGKAPRLFQLHQEDIDGFDRLAKGELLRLELDLTSQRVRRAERVGS